ncbi:MAG: transporter substrate-binding domain-containing protein [Lachnospiraceae bacterium]|nr:transporter substrate-binding domain-containing protein [Lachnospiraceae bacterium]
MKKKFLTTTAAAMMLTLSACGQPKEEPIPSVLDDNHLVIGLVDTEDRSCYRMLDENGEVFYAGLEPDILMTMSREMGSMLEEEVVYEYRYARDQAELLSWLNTGEVELAAGSFTRLDTYAQQYSLSDDYGVGSLYLVNKKNGYLDTLAAFEDEAIGVSAQIPAGNISEMTGIENVVQNQYTDVGMLASDITNGVISAAVCTEPEMYQILSNTDLKATELRNTPQVSMVFLSSLGQDYLMQWVNYAIDKCYYDEAMGITYEEEAQEDDLAGGGR